MSEEVAKKVEIHTIEIGAIKSMFAETSAELKDSIKATNALTSQLAVYIAKNEHNKEQIQTIKLDAKDMSANVYKNSLAIADMYPTVIALRGLIWKITGVIVLGGGGVAALIVAAEKTLIR